MLTVLVSLQLSALGQRVHPKHGAEVPYAPHQQLCKEGREREKRGNKWRKGGDGRKGGEGRERMKGGWGGKEKGR